MEQRIDEAIYSNFKLSNFFVTFLKVFVANKFTFEKIYFLIQYERLLNILDSN